jgi:hypothetical protein
MRIPVSGLALLFSLTGFAQVKMLNAETTIQNEVIFSSGARVEKSC